MIINMHIQIFVPEQPESVTTKRLSCQLEHAINLHYSSVDFVIKQLSFEHRMFVSNTFLLFPTYETLLLVHYWEKRSKNISVICNTKQSIFILHPLYCLVDEP